MLAGSPEAGPSQRQSSSLLFCRQRTTSILRSPSRIDASSDATDSPVTPSQRRRRIAAFSPSPLEDLSSSSDAAIPSRRKLSRAEKDILFGSLAGMVAKVFEHPFDLIKVRLQTQPFTTGSPGSPPKGTLYTGAFDAFRSTIRKEGVLGLYRGLSMPIIGATLENATLFFTYNAIQGQIRRIAGSSNKAGGEEEEALSLPQLAIAAAGAGAVTSYVLTPVELIKCRMQVQMVSVEADILAKMAAQSSSATSTVNITSALNTARRSLPGPVSLFAETIRQQGIRGLWLGQTGTLLRETGGGVAWFLAFESTCRWFLSRQQSSALSSTKKTKDDLSSWQLMLAGAMAGVSYNVVLFPADCVKSTIQTELELRPKGSTAGPPLSFMSTFKNIYKTRGISGLYAGCGITCLRSGPSSALIFLLYSRLEGWADRRGW